jgi:hypothetical protein
MSTLTATSQTTPDTQISPDTKYIMVIITTHFDLPQHVLEHIQQHVPTVLEAASAQTARRADGCLIVDVPSGDLAQLERVLEEMSDKEVYDYLTINWRDAAEG